MSRFKNTNKSYQDETTPFIKFDNTLYKGPKLVRSDSGNHTFEIYEEVKKVKKKNKSKNKSIRKLLREVIIKIDLLLSIKNI